MRKKKRVHKIPWDLWKIEWINNLDEDSLSNWLTQKYASIGRKYNSRHNGHVSKKTMGWHEDRKQHKLQLMAELAEHNRNNLKEKFIMDPEELDKAHKLLVQAVIARVSSNIVKGENGRVSEVNVSAKEIFTAYEIIKNEKGEPSKTTLQRNENKDLDLEDILKAYKKTTKDVFDQ